MRSATVLFMRGASPVPNPRSSRTPRAEPALRLTRPRSMAQHRRHHDPPGRRSARRRLAPEARVTRAERRVASPRVVGVNDLRPLARRRVPRAVFDYIDGGADGEGTLP